MRLWHKDLIPILPRQQLLGQWRECCLIAKNITEKGTPNHILVNKIMDYPINHFFAYVGLVIDEMKRRNYKCDISSFKKHMQITDFSNAFPDKDELFNGWHDKRYYNQCFYNLQEKFDCGGITPDEWLKIENQILKLISEADE